MHKLGLVLVVGAGVVVACGSSGSDQPAGNAGSGGSSAGAGVAGRAGASNGGAGLNEGGRAGNGVAGGRDDAGASGAVEGGSAGIAGEVGAAGSAGSDGDAGAPGDEAPAFAYLATYLPGGVSALSLDPLSGKPTLIAGSAVDAGGRLYALTVDPSQRFLYTANQQTGDVKPYRIGADGKLTAGTPKTHANGSFISLSVDPQGHFLYGLNVSDKSVYTFAIDAATGELTSSGVPKAVGEPVYVAVDPTGHYLYASQGFPAGIRGYSVNRDTGALTEVAGSPFADATTVNAGALAFAKNGNFLYSSGGGALNAFAIEVGSGKLSLVAGSPFTTEVSADPHATNLVVTPQGDFLYVSDFGLSRHVSGFSIDATTGKLTPVPGPVPKTPSPYALGIAPSGRFLFVGEDSGQVSVFALNRQTGALSPIVDSPFTLGGLQPQFAFAAPQP